ncbi:MAG: ABC transporter ATP-binding protein [Candidatus Lokiarchaeota archaeon]|nr:ABC transporter ATP-binding protein [Candidatus Harpocratesius repetitus]
MSESSIIKINHLTKKFGDFTAVNDISFNVYQGEILGILGPNGAGKTTTIRMITGVFHVNKSNCIKVNGIDILESPEYKSHFGIVPEVSNAYLDFTVWQNLNFSGLLYGMSKSEIEKQGTRLLKLYGLEEKRNAITKSLSKGLKQRLNFCMALIHDPNVLILDEPTTGLDPLSVRLLRSQILELQKEGKTILITTHDLREAEKVCNRILILYRGKIIADETPENLRRKFKSETVITLEFDPKPNNWEYILKELRDKFRAEQKNGIIHIISENVLQDMASLYDFVQNKNLNLEKIKVIEPTLEDAFIDLIQNQQKSEKL